MDLFFYFLLVSKYFIFYASYVSEGKGGRVLNAHLLRSQQWSQPCVKSSAIALWNQCATHEDVSWRAGSVPQRDEL